MKTKDQPLTGLRALVLGGLCAMGMGLQPRAARADEPLTAEQAAATAQHYRERADAFRAWGGGAAYKTGLVQRAEAQEIRYSALAGELAGAEYCPPAPAAPGERPEKPDVRFEIPATP